MRGGAPGTGISCAQIMGTLSQPCSRAARAGNSAERSGVSVKMAEMIRDGFNRLVRLIVSHSAATAAAIAAEESRSTWMAPRIPSIPSSPLPLTPVGRAAYRNAELGDLHHIQA